LKKEKQFPDPVRIGLGFFRERLTRHSRRDSLYMNVVRAMEQRIWVRMSGMIYISVRFARPADREQLARLRAALWPESSAEEHLEELVSILAVRPPGRMPLVVLVAAAADGTLAGFLEAGLRSHADGCGEAHAVGYVEGWCVVEKFRRCGIGAELLRAAEDWARGQGCVEMASDAQIENEVSQRAHEALGFGIASRSVNYRKAL
jgi:aminoglycoside 6'-N-acetyltransferase I